MDGRLIIAIGTDEEALATNLKEGYDGTRIESWSLGGKVIKASSKCLKLQAQSEIEVGRVPRLWAYLLPKSTRAKDSLRAQDCVYVCVVSSQTA
jgi:hypothetical protein